MKESTARKDFYEDEALVAARYITKNFWESRYHNKRMNILDNLMKSTFVRFQSFLDVGCGTGEYLSFAKKFASDVYGSDLSKNYLLRSKSANPNDLILADSAQMPFKDCSFNSILCSEVIEHIKEQDCAIVEITRISQKSVLISTPTHGLLRQIMSLVSPRKLASVDSKVGHVSILEFLILLNKLKSKDWRIRFAYTVHIFPPFLDEIHIPRILEPIVSIIEGLLNRVLPEMGTLSIFYLERVPIRI